MFPPNFLYVVRLSEQAQAKPTVLNIIVDAFKSTAKHSKLMRTINRNDACDAKIGNVYSLLSTAEEWVVPRRSRTLKATSWRPAGVRTVAAVYRSAAAALPSLLSCLV